MLHLMFLLAFHTSTNDYCNADNPNPAYYNNVCTGNNAECNVNSPTCSVVPNTPGTWNPGGYTPKMG